ncbi:MAG TPA: copper-containing nitrite reductase [Devosia sp.]|jgi:nitrite reductase (NO-forming)|uniref:copper-containing nitrite reductase n=1 Tax=Devosia sp. TaxID=1871048 RepID=UPI002DDD6167|nr:copper-containing nitrite reductase [Devosia sp.]HEV2515846.1 copper-containing nitrite reductase [Devosia sp.]
MDAQNEVNVSRRALLAGAAFAGVFGTILASAPAAAEDAGVVTGPVPDLAHLPRKKVELVAPPFVHPHEQITTSGPQVVEFTLTIEEKEMVLDEYGTTVQAMTFNGSVPAPLMVVHQDDYVELTLINPDTNMMQHNIDFHSATGALGGGGLTLINPGEQVKLRFKATRPGAFVYHCAPGGPMIPWHVVSGMNGAILVLPRDGLKDGLGNALHYDRIYYIGEQDFYVPRDEAGNFKTYPTAGDGYDDMLRVMKTLTPTHEVFNGAVGALTGENAMQAKVGETVLIIHSQANRDTRPHLIGGHGDYVWATGKFRNPPEVDLETWHIPGGCAGAALYTFLQPGIYAYVNHNLIEAVELGATAHFTVEGDWNDDLMTQVQPPTPIG